MTAIGPFDDRLLFYLRHKDTIREWAAIRHDVRKATHQILLGLPLSLEPTLAGSDSAGPFEIHAEATETNYPRIVIRRPEWPYELQESVVGVCVEWNPTKVDPSDSAPPFYGIRVGKERTGGRALRELLRARIQQDPRFAKAFAVRPRDPYWPVMQHVPASEDWWQHVDEWVADVCHRVVGTWSLGAATIDAALDEAGPIFGPSAPGATSDGEAEPQTAPPVSEFGDD